MKSFLSRVVEHILSLQWAFALKPLQWLHLSLGGGYEIDTGGKMKLLTTRNNMQYRGDDKIRWNGFRLNAGLIFAIPNYVFKENGNQ